MTYITFKLSGNFRIMKIVSNRIRDKLYYCFKILVSKKRFITSIQNFETVIIIKYKHKHKRLILFYNYKIHNIKMYTGKVRLCYGVIS